jgi:hypothetical protein
MDKRLTPDSSSTSCRLSGSLRPSPPSFLPFDLDALPLSSSPYRLPPPYTLLRIATVLTSRTPDESSRRHSPRLLHISTEKRAVLSRRVSSCS